MADLLNIGTSGLLANQIGMSTTGHNIANANVEGYSRQQTLYEARPPEAVANGYKGAGVMTQQVRRISDQFLVNQLRQDIEGYSSNDTYLAAVSQIESLIANEHAGLTAGMQNFFAAVQVAAEDPNSLTARQQVLATAQNLESRFTTLHKGLVDQSSALDSQIQGAVIQVNKLGKTISDLNQKIAIAQGQAGGVSPNDLLDKRDIALNELSALVSVNTSVRDGNQIDVFIGKGQALVLGSNATELQIKGSVRSGEPTIHIGSTDVTRSLDSGAIGGMLRASDSLVTSALNTIGQIGIALSAELNAVHERGIDMFGEQGKALFSNVNSSDAQHSRAIPSNANSASSDGVIGVSISDVSQLTTDDYLLTFNGPNTGDYTLTNTSSGEIVSAGTLATSPASISTPEGFDITLESGRFAQGDEVHIQPTRNGAREFSVAISRPESLALAQAVRTGATDHNTGSGGVSEARVLSVRTADNSALLPDFTSPGQLATPLLVRFDSPTSYSILDNSDPENPVDLVPPQNNLSFVPGSSNDILPSDSLDPAYRGYVFSINGAPETGDEFYVEYNSGGTGDNRNALALSDVQITPLLNNGFHSVTDTYNAMIQDIAVDVSDARSSRDASEALMIQTQNSIDSVSGVNLDEEAAKLIQLEQAYNASAQVISVARTIFDSILNAVR